MGDSNEQILMPHQHLPVPYRDEDGQCIGDGPWETLMKNGQGHLIKKAIEEAVVYDPANPGKTWEGYEECPTCGRLLR